MQDNLAFSQMFNSIHNFDLLSVYTAEIQELMNKKPSYVARTNLIEEQEKFLQFIYDIANKKKSEKVPLTFDGKVIKIAIIFVKSIGLKSIDLHLRLINDFAASGYCTIYLLAIGSKNSAIGNFAARIYSKQTEYRISWKRSLRHCPMVDKRTIIRLSKIRPKQSEFDEGFLYV